MGMFNHYTVRCLLLYSLQKKPLKRTFYICGVLRSAAAAAAAAADGRQWVS
jgi:hypothetical protein